MANARTRWHGAGVVEDDDEVLRLQCGAAEGQLEETNVGVHLAKADAELPLDFAERVVRSAVQCQ